MLGPSASSLATVHSNRTTLRVVLALGASLAAAATGCSAHGAGDTGDQDIINGRAATEYPEAALVDFQKDGKPFICSGSIIAPRVVLTAGHCVAGAGSWFVHAGSVSSTASSATVFDYHDTSDHLDLSRHDIGLVFLDDPIQLPSYPTIASSPVPDGTSVFNVGRILNGTQTDSLFGRAIAVQDASFNGAPFDYNASLVIQPGDSGGPDFIAGTHTIVAVNSGEQTVSGIEFLARVDLMHDFIQQQIAAHGGAGGGGGGGVAPADDLIPESTLRSVDRYEVVSEQLNCRSAPGTGAAIEQKLFRGQVVDATEVPSRPRVGVAPDGNLWVLVQPPFGGACYVSGKLDFLAPRPDMPAPPPAAPLVVNPGLYGSLALAVHDGVVTGSVHEGACEFTIAGRIPSANPIDVRVLTPASNDAGRLEIVDANTVSFSTSNLPSACFGIFDPVELSGGIVLGMRANVSSSVMAFRTIQATKAFFHDAPGSPPRGAFVIRGQTVRQIGENVGGFVDVTFTNPQGVTTEGFVSTSDLVSLGSAGGPL